MYFQKEKLQYNALFLFSQVYYRIYLIVEVAKQKTSSYTAN